MDESSLITEAITAAVGVESAPVPVTVPGGTTEPLRALLGAADVPPGGIAPPSAMQQIERVLGMPGLPDLPRNSLITGDEWSWRRPLRVGETLSGVYRLAHAYERVGGRLGHALFLRHEWVLTDAAGAEAALKSRTLAYFPAGRLREREAYGPPPVPRPPLPDEPGADPRAARTGDPLPQRTVTVQPAQVGGYIGEERSGDTDRGPVFFKDPEKAREMGLPGMIVPGPLKHALLATLVFDWSGPGAFLQMVRVAYRRPDPQGSPLTLGGAVSDVQETGDGRRLTCDLWIMDATGERTVAGSAELLLPAAP